MITKQKIKDLFKRISEEKEPEEILKIALKEFKDKIGLATSFSLEDIVLIDMITKIDSQPKIFTLDTGRLFEETYRVWERIEKHYQIKIEPFFPNTLAVEEMIKTYGPNLFYQSVELRRLCCKIRKVDSLKRALSGLDAWITGLRHEQSSERAKLKKIERDLRNNCLKINPILEWSYDQVWNYVKKRGLPYNELHDKGYPSIGCAPCTRPAESSGSRDGRWFWESSQTKECGLHK